MNDQPRHGRNSLTLDTRIAQRLFNSVSLDRVRYINGIVADLKNDYLPPWNPSWGFTYGWSYDTTWIHPKTWNSNLPNQFGYSNEEWPLSVLIHEIVEMGANRLGWPRGTDDERARIDELAYTIQARFNEWLGETGQKPCKLEK